MSRFSRTCAVGVIGLLLVVAIIGCSAEDAETPADAKQSSEAGSAEQRGARFRRMAGQRGGQASESVPVEVARVKRGVVDAHYRGSTNLSAAEEAVVVARTLGVVEALYVEEGDLVKAQQPLAQLETDRLHLELERSRTQLASLKAAFERAEQLNESRMISPTEFDTARYSYETERTNLKLREYELREATIRATINGVITRRHIKVGHTLAENAPAFEMKRLDSIEAELNIPEREIERISVGQFANVVVDALPEAPFAGEVARVAPEVDPTSGTFRAMVTIANADGRLKPGMFGRVDIRTDRRPNALLTPVDAVVTVRDKSSLFVVTGDVVERRVVTTGYVSEGNIEILTGVSEGEQVVMSGQDGLRDGTSVRIVEAYQPATSS